MSPFCAIAALIAHGGKVQALVEDLPRLAGAAARHRTADVALMRDRAGKAEQRAVDEHRRDDRDVRRVRAAAVIGMVDDEGVAFGDVAAERIDDGGGAGRKRADMQRQHHVLRHHLAVRVHQRAGGILQLPHDGGEAGAKQRVLHLLHDAGEARLHHFEVDGVDGHGYRSCLRRPGATTTTIFASCVTIRFFHSSTRAVWPGQITVVQSS